MEETNVHGDKGDGRRRIMQVVELDEDTPVDDTSSPSAEEKVQSLKSDIPPQSHSTAIPESPLTNEKQREIVSEMFQKPPESLRYPDITINEHKKSSPLILWVLTVILIVAAIGGGLIFFKAFSFSTPTLPFIAKEPTPTVEPTIEVTPTPSIIKKDVTIQVLNGSGVAGAATKMKKILEEKGYTVAGTGNAKKYDYQLTEIIYKSGKDIEAANVRTDLSADYSIGSESATLDDKSTYDMQVIIGKE